MIELNKAQEFMQATDIDAWLLYDFRGSNPVFWNVLGYEKKTTRRAFLFIPAQGSPCVIASVVEPHVFTTAECPLEIYVDRHSLRQKLGAYLNNCQRVAMEYSPEAILPILSWVDGGTLEMVRACSVEVVSSADLFQAALATWTESALTSHYSACVAVAEVKDEAFEFIKQHLRKGKVFNEYDVQDYIVQLLKNIN